MLKNMMGNKQGDYKTNTEYIFLYVTSQPSYL